ncbi:MAG: hypothetical protein PHH13_02010 [Candidatus Peribacteraceae bacterium]|nr:hypothetical protein [Candidatus Peribacteraceae bacterium]
MRLKTLLLLLFLLTLPLPAAAMQSEVWNFIGGSGPGDWEVRDLSQQPIPTTEGLRILTTSEGLIARPNTISFPIDALRIETLTANDMEIVFAWLNPSIAQNSYLQLPFLIKADSMPRTTSVDLTTISEWPGRSQRLGFAFPKGTDLLIRRVEFLHWNPFEKLLEAIKSFWTFDTLNVHSVNFVWGPLLTFTPIARMQMANTDPPIAYSANAVFYVLAAFAALCCFLLARRGTTMRPRPLVLFFLIVAGLWVFYDLRMGAEILSYARTDWQSYVMAKPGNRSFRIFQNFYDVLETVRPDLQKTPSYLFVGPRGENFFLATARYETYPSLPQPLPQEPITESSLALVYGRPDAGIDEEGHFVVDGKIVAGSASVIRTFPNFGLLLELKP